MTNLSFPGSCLPPLFISMVPRSYGSCHSCLWDLWWFSLSTPVFPCQLAFYQCSIFIFHLPLVQYSIDMDYGVQYSIDMDYGVQYSIGMDYGVHYTGCGRKNSPIWEANKFKTKEDTANVFLFLERTPNAVLHQRVLNKTALKWWPWILKHWRSLSR